MASQIRAKAVRTHLGGKVSTTVLPSGLTVVTEQMPGSRTMSLGIFIGVGSCDEADAQSGSAHFLEHILFKGTKKRTAQQISSAFDSIGGDSNAYTAKDHTCFYAKVLDDDAQIALDVLSDMMRNSLLDAQDFESERRVILDEITMHADDPLETGHALVASSLYAGNPLAREVIGSKTTIKALSRDDVAAFWKKHYKTGNIVVSAAGNVDHGQLVETFSAWRGADKDYSRKTAPLEPLTAQLKTRARPTGQSTCVLGFRGYGRFDERRYGADMLALILGGGMSSRLFVQVREMRGLAYHIDATSTAYGDAGSFIIEWMCAPDLVVPIIDVVREQVHDVLACGVTEEELLRAKGQMRGATLLAFESPDTRMMRIGKAQLFGDTRTMSDILDGYESVTTEQVQQVAHDLLIAPATLAVVGAKTDRSPLERAVQSWEKSLA